MKIIQINGSKGLQTQFASGSVLARPASTRRPVQGRKPVTRTEAFFGSKEEDDLEKMMSGFVFDPSMQVSRVQLCRQSKIPCIH